MGLASTGAGSLTGGLGGGGVGAAGFGTGGDTTADGAMKWTMTVIAASGTGMTRNANSPQSNRPCTSTTPSTTPQENRGGLASREGANKERKKEGN